MATIEFTTLIVLALFQNVSGENIENGICNADNFECVKDQILHKDTISAISRAKTEECKDKLRKNALMADNLYPNFIKSECMFYEEVTYLGCFQSNENTKVFKDGMMKKFPKFNRSS